MVEWDADLYRQFEDQRTRPARDLLQRVRLQGPGDVIDLGCGPGNSTELLVEKFPQANVIGLDNSEAMLASARQRLPACRFANCDIAAWHPATPPSLIYANASLQWVPEHEVLLPRLLACLVPGGVLAVQMPDNRSEPTHALMRETAAAGAWAATIGDTAALRIKVHSLLAYYDMLAPDAAEIDIWRTAYHHPMQSAAAIVDWVRGTGLKPFIEPLTEPQRRDFLALYEAKIAAAYPPHPDGRRLLAFPRMFIVARRRQ